MPRPNSTTIPGADAADASQQALREQILRLKAKAFQHAVCDDYDSKDSTFREEFHAVGHMDDSAPPAQHHLRLKRRLPQPRRSDTDLCECESDIITTRHLSSSQCQSVPAQQPCDGADEFTEPDGSFKLPRLLHPVLKRQHAVASYKREHEPLARSPRVATIARPSRVLPCVTARAIALRLVQ